MNTFTAAVPDRARPDPAKRVNYTYGMLLGVDDFVQDSAYFGAKGDDIVRELSGYGVVRGLHVEYQPTPAGSDRAPRIAVLPGLATVPSGRRVKVNPTQCADLQAWLSGHRAVVLEALGGAPASGQITLAVLLRYSELATDPVPIPGEPCRSADDLLAPSRLREDFRLELVGAQSVEQRAALPAQHEEQLIRQLVGWLRQVPVVSVGASTLDTVLAAVRIAAGKQNTDAPCPSSATAFAQVPPAGLTLPAAGLADYLEAVFRVWVRELLPCWRVPDSSSVPETAQADDQPDTLRLADVTLDVLYDAVQDTFGVGPLGAVVSMQLDATVLSVRLLQEWALSAPVTPVAPTVGSTVVAAGFLDPTGAAPAAPFFSRGGLSATPRAAPEDDVMDLSFTEFDATATYLVSGTPMVDPAAAVHTVELVAPGAGGKPAVRVRRATTSGSSQLLGIQLVVAQVGP